MIRQRGQWEDQIEDTILSTLKKTGFEERFENVSWNWNRRLKITAGRAYYNRDYIEFSPTLWEYASEKERKQIIVHELCHLISFWKYYRAGVGHGPLWKKTMEEAGVEPSVFHSIGTGPDAGIIPDRRLAKCSCRTWQITRNRVTRMKKGAKYRCAFCNTRLELLEG